MFASFGSASGGIEAFNLRLFPAAKGLALRHPPHATHLCLVDRARLEKMARDLIRAVGNGDVTTASACACRSPRPPRRTGRSRRAKRRAPSSSSPETCPET